MPAATSRPQIICHMVTTLDGRLHAERWPYPEEAILEAYEEAAGRLDADGWIAGRRTMEQHVSHGSPNAGSEVLRRADRIGSAVTGQIAVCIDREGRLLPESGEVDGDHLVLVVSERVTERHVDLLAARGVSIVFAGPDGNDIADALSRIGKEFGVRRLLLEGGGLINGAFLAADLIDETSTLMLPVIDGAQGTPSIYECAGDTQPRQLELIAADTLDGGKAWLRHRVVRD